MKLLSTEVARNYALSPAAAVSGGAGFGAYLAGTGETGTTSWVTGAADGPVGIQTYARRTVTAAKTGGSTGWQSVASAHRAPVTGSAGALVTISLYVRYSGPAGQSVRLRAMLYDAAGANVGSTDSGTFALVPNEWVRVSCTVTATGAFATAGWWAFHVSGSGPASSTTYDATGVLIEKGSALGPWFSGASASAAGYVPGVDSYRYAWTGTADASASTKSLIQPNLLAEPLADGPWAGVTLRGLEAGTAVLTLWRTAGGQRLPVRGARKLEAVDSVYVIDYEAPLGQAVTYDVEFLEGPDTGANVPPAAVTVASECGYIHDPLDPSVVVKVWASRAPNGEAVLAGPAFAELQRSADVAVHHVLGSSLPVAIGGQRRAPSGVDLSLLTDAEAENTKLRDMVKQAAVLVVRPLPGWLGDALAPVVHLAVPDVVEVPLTARLPQTVGRYLTRWTIVGDQVRASTASVLIALFTYQDVEALFATYAQKQASAGGGTYLDDLKNPLGA